MQSLAIQLYSPLPEENAVSELAYSRTSYEMMILLFHNLIMLFENIKKISLACRNNGLKIIFQCPHKLF